MINKKNLIKIFIVFFIINMLYFTLNKAYALTLMVGTDQVTLNEGETKTIQVISYDPSLGDGLRKSISPVSANDPLGGVEVSIHKDSRSSNSNYTVWKVAIKGTKKGKASITFGISGQISPAVIVTINDKNSASNSTNSTNSTNMVSINTNVLRENLSDEFDPRNQIGGFNVSNPVINVIIPVVSKIIIILQIIGAIILVLSIAIAGFNGVLGSGDGFAEDLGLNVATSVNEYGNKVDGVQNLNQASLSKIIRRAIIGTLILESSLTIVRIVFAICTNL